jgi:hypothetical protein
MTISYLTGRISSIGICIQSSDVLCFSLFYDLYCSGNCYSLCFIDGDYIILQIVEFISVLLSIGSEVAEMRLIHLGAIKHVIDLFFE